MTLIFKHRYRSHTEVKQCLKEIGADPEVQLLDICFTTLYKVYTTLSIP